jgi:2-dehydropantoate 2-reductase
LKVCVLGAGALGSTIGGLLAEAGSEVWLVTRAAHAEAVNRHGLVLVDSLRERTVRLRACTDPAQVGPVDLVIVLVKSYDTAAAMATARPLLGPDTVVLSLQNGLGHEEILAKAAGRARLLAGKTYVGGVLLEPGRVRVGVNGKETVLGELDGADTPRLRRIATLFEAAGLRAVVSHDILSVIWDKLLVNVATGALSGVTRLPYGALYAVPEVEACAVAAVAEAMAVAAAHNITLATREPRDAWVKAAEGLPPEFRASMLQSLERGAPTEIDYINGAVVRWGGERGVPTPVNQALVACIKGIEAGRRAAPVRSAAA